MQQKVKRKRNIGIKDLPLAARPREKFLSNGSENISEEELIALLLGTGSRRYNAVQLSRALLARYPLNTLVAVTVPDLVSVSGIGKTKATRLLASVELGKRIFTTPPLTKVIIRTTKDVLLQAREFIEKKQEYLVVFYLNARYEVLQKEIVGQGGLNKLLITPKEIFSHAVASPCASLVVVHNHPSGDPTPSDDDITFTKRIHEAGEVMGITLLDHVILAKEGYFSFRENKRGNKS